MLGTTRLAQTLLVLCSLTACGGKSVVADGPGAAGTDAGGAGQGSTNATGGASSHAGTSAQAGAGGVSSCAAHDDDLGTRIDVVIENRTSAVLYLGTDSVTCGLTPRFQVQDVNGRLLPGPSDCPHSCLQARTNGVGGCATVCILPSAVPLQPGQKFMTSYDGLEVLQTSLPQGCLDTGVIAEGTFPCEQSKRIQPGDYVFSARAGLQLECSLTGDASCGVCPSGDPCEIPGATIAGAPVVAQTLVSLDGSYGLYPAPDSGSAGADAPSPGAGAAPAGPVIRRSVEIVFEEDHLR